MARSSVAVKFTGDTNSLKRALGDLDGKMRSTGSALGKLGKTAAIGFAGVTAGAAVIGKGLIDAATESQKVTKQTEAVVKSMGAASNVTAAQVAKLSEKLSLQSGVDDELIQSAQNVLLTFGKVRNEVGKGNDIFDRASQSALDMSVALGTDMQGATIQLGKALNDPVKGITALSRAGVSFSKEQKDTIKRLVETGDVLGAQKIILGELDKEFGGSAKAQATAGDKLKVAWGNVQEQLGSKLLPIFEKVATAVADKLPRAMEKAERIIGPVAKNIGMFFKTLTSGFTEDEGTPVERFALKVREALQKVAAFVQEWGPMVIAAFQKIVAWTQENWPKIQQIITQVVTTIATVVSGVVSVITTLWDNFGNNILSFVQRVWPRIQQVISGALTIIRGVVQTVTALIKGDWGKVWDGIKSIVRGAWQAIQGIIGGALEAIRGALGIGLEIIGSIFKGAWNRLVGWFSSIPSKVRDIAKGIWEGMKAGLSAAIRWIKDKLDSLLGPLDEIAGKVGSIVGGGKNLLGSIPGVGLLGGLLAEGGPAKAGKAYIVGERGPELFVPKTSGTVIPNGASSTPQLAAAPVASMPSGNTYSINVSVATGGDPAAVGKAIVEAIAAYERRSGTRWRAAS